LIRDDEDKRENSRLTPSTRAPFFSQSRRARAAKGPACKAEDRGCKSRRRVHRLISRSVVVQQLGCSRRRMPCLGRATVNADCGVVCAFAFGQIFVGVLAHSAERVVRSDEAARAKLAHSTIDPCMVATDTARPRRVDVGTQVVQCPPGDQSLACSSKAEQSADNRSTAARYRPSQPLCCRMEQRQLVWLITKRSAVRIRLLHPPYARGRQARRRTPNPFHAGAVPAGHARSFYTRQSSIFPLCGTARQSI
jgi:hypothetical protein